MFSSLDKLDQINHPLSFRIAKKDKYQVEPENILTSISLPIKND